MVLHLLLMLALVGLFFLACACPGDSPAPSDHEEYGSERHAMVARQVEARGIQDPRVLAALRTVPRHRFVPAEWQAEAYDDHPLPIGGGQTISQPYIVALMTELAEIGPGSRVLEIGTGSGYQAAVLCALGVEVYTIEIIPELAEQAWATLSSLEYAGIHVRAGDGYAGWPEAAPFDAVLVTAAPPKVPAPLLEQLRDGGRLVVPEGTTLQDLAVYTRSGDDVARTVVVPVRFVPMTGQAQQGR